jgi:hypothetical protein
LCRPDQSEQRDAASVIADEASNASGRKDLGQHRASEAGTGSEIARRSLSDAVAPASGILIGCSNAKPTKRTGGACAPLSEILRCARVARFSQDDTKKRTVRAFAA